MIEGLDFKLLEKLTQLNGVSGYEKAVRQEIEKIARPLCDEMMTDAIGNLICLVRGSGENKKRIMLAAHMDEIGVQVIKINDDGTLMVKSMGTSWIYTSFQARVQFRDGLTGVIDARVYPDQLQNKFTNLYVDIGVASKEEAEKYVHVGDVACFVGSYTPLAGDFVTSKAVDDRIGCFLQLEVMKALQGKPVCNDLYFVFTVQEEVGCRGSIVSAERIAPDIGIAVDVTPDHGRPGDLEGSNECGGGTAIKISDTSVICDEDLVAMMIGIAEEQGIKYQRDVIYVGGTDASSMNMARYGARACAVSVCTRYTHGTNCIFNKKDAEGSVELLTRFVNLEFAG